MLPLPAGVAWCVLLGTSTGGLGRQWSTAPLLQQMGGNDLDTESCAGHKHWARWGQVQRGACGPWRVAGDFFISGDLGCCGHLCDG